MSDRDVNATEHTVTARKLHPCGGYRCTSTIRPGENYVRLVAFPGHDANGSTTPWVLNVCVSCWREHDPAKPMPPRKTNPTTTPPPATPATRED